MSGSIEAKKSAGYAAVDNYVETGMRVGLGTGSTVVFALERLGEKLKKGILRDILAVVTSMETHLACQELSIPIADLGDPRISGELDLAIDGADEVDPGHNLIKGGGGALLPEKVVAHASAKYVVVVDPSKLKDTLGNGFPVPIEVLPSAWALVKSRVEAMGASVNFRLSGGKRGPVITDNGNFLMDAHFFNPVNPKEMEERLAMIPGLLESGFFTGLKPIVLVGEEGGKIVTRVPV
jgi:ribose 5-phosphate isomerase A